MLISDVVNDVVVNSRSIISCAFSVLACSRNVVGVATGLRSGRPVARILVWPRDLSSKTSTLALGPHPLSYSIGTGVPFRGAKRSGRGVNHSPVSSAKVKNEWKYVYISTPHIYLYGRDGKNFIFQFTLLYRCLSLGL